MTHSCNVATLELREDKHAGETVGNTGDNDENRSRTRCPSGSVMDNLVS